MPILNKMVQRHEIRQNIMLLNFEEIKRGVEELEARTRRAVICDTGHLMCFHQDS